MSHEKPERDPFKDKFITLKEFRSAMLLQEGITLNEELGDRLTNQKAEEVDILKGDNNKYYLLSCVDGDNTFVGLEDDLIKARKMARKILNLPEETN